MKTNKLLIGTIVGGIAFFFLGWLVYGLILMDYMASHTNPAFMKPMDQMIWWALIVSNIVWGLLLTLILDWADALSLERGAKIAALVGFLFALSLDLSFYSMYNMFSDFSVLFVDVLATVIMWAIAGALVGWVLRKEMPVDGSR